MPDSVLKISERFDGQVLEIRLADPPANVLSRAMMAELRELLAAERKPSARKAIVVGGEGKHFSFGASVPEHQAEQVGQMLPMFHAMIGEVLDHPVPIIARVSGQCLGGGFELALAASLVFADDTARFAVPEIQLGVFPPVAAVLLPQMAPAALTGRMVFGAEAIDAGEMERFGLLAGRAHSGELEALVDQWIGQQLVPLSAASLRLAHRAARAAIVGHYRGHIEAAERLYLDELMQTRDASEGIAAFIERRPPEWKDA